MNKSTEEKKRDGGPFVYRFKARLFRDPKAPKTGSWALLEIPTIVSRELRGMTKVEGTMNGHPFRAPLEPNTSGGYLLRVNNAMREGAGAGEGDTVKLAILGPEPEPTVPADLRSAFKTSSQAKSLWSDLTILGRLDWVRWIEAAKTPQTRARRITRTVEQLSEGKRRPCCVNVYEFMLRRVQE
jgi:hypothetical protein